MAGQCASKMLRLFLVILLVATSLLVGIYMYVNVWTKQEIASFSGAVFNHIEVYQTAREMCVNTYSDTVSLDVPHEYCVKTSENITAEDVTVTWLQLFGDGVSPIPAESTEAVVAHIVIEKHGRTLIDKYESFAENGLNELENIPAFSR